MIGLFVVFLLSWLLLWRLTGEPITVLGIAPNSQRAKEFLIGFAFMAGIAVINFVWQAHLKELTYQFNPEYSVLDFLGGSCWIAKAVVFEELVFRGALLYLLIKRIGLIKACLLSSVVFGIYHWFSYGVFGSRLILMAYIFLVTGAGGWMFAFTYAKTKSLFAPTGLHLGWNMVTAIVFSSGPIGNQLLIEQGVAVEWNEWFTLLFFSLQAIVAPGIVTCVLHARYKSTESSSNMHQAPTGG
ncbi:MAG: hypothetical protein RhofKO_15470 [Rhodothermales bacterium]